MVCPVVTYCCWEPDCKEGRAPENQRLQTVVLEKTLESPLDYMEMKPVNPKGNQSWTFNGRTDAEAEAPILWSLDMKTWLIRKEPDAGKIEGKTVRGWHRMRAWMASLTQWTWVWASSGRLWRTGKPGVLQSMGSQSRMWLSHWKTNHHKCSVAHTDLTGLYFKNTNIFLPTNQFLKELRNEISIFFRI